MPRIRAEARDAFIETRKQQILAAAAQVFAAKGYDGATIRDVARAAGVAEGSIYNYFESKQDLLVHLPRLFVQPALESFITASANADYAPPPEQLLTRIAENIVHVILANRELVRVLISSLPTMAPALRAEYIKEVPLTAISALESYIRSLQAAGIVDADLNPAIAARAFPGLMLFFLMVQDIVQPPGMPRYEYDQVIPTIVRIYLHGILRADLDARALEKTPPVDKTPSPRRDRRKPRRTKASHARVGRRPRTGRAGIRK